MFKGKNAASQFKGLHMVKTEPKQMENAVRDAHTRGQSLQTNPNPTNSNRAELKPKHHLTSFGSSKCLLYITINVGGWGDAKSFSMKQMSWLFQTMMKDKHLKPVITTTQLSPTATV